MKIISTKFFGLKVIQSKIYKDSRGFFKEDYKKKFFKSKKLIFGCASSSKKNVVRGLHLQTKFSQEKYVSILKGSILDVVVDLRKNSKTFGKHFAIEMSQKSDFSLYIPKGFAHGFICLSKSCVVYYKCTNYRDKKSEVTIKLNDRDLKIKWPINKPILSKKDKKGIPLSEY